MAVSCQVQEQLGPPDVLFSHLGDWHEKVAAVIESLVASDPQQNHLQVHHTRAMIELAETKCTLDTLIDEVFPDRHISSVNVVENDSARLLVAQRSRYHLQEKQKEIHKRLVAFTPEFDALGIAPMDSSSSKPEAASSSTKKSGSAMTEIKAAYQNRARSTLLSLSRSYQGLIATSMADSNPALNEYQFTLHLAKLSYAEEEIRKIAGELCVIRAMDGPGSLLENARQLDALRTPSSGTAARESDARDIAAPIVTPSASTGSSNRAKAKARFNFDSARRQSLLKRRTQAMPGTGSSLKPTRKLESHQPVSASLPESSGSSGAFAREGDDGDAAAPVAPVVAPPDTVVRQSLLKQRKCTDVRSTVAPVAQEVAAPHVGQRQSLLKRRKRAW